MDMSTERDTFDRDDVETLLRAVEQSLLADPEIQADRPWNGLFVVGGFEPAHSSYQIGKFDGVLPLPVRSSLGNPALSKELWDPIRALTEDPDRGPWRTWVMRYDEQTDTFDHRFFWPGEDAGWDVLRWDVSSENIAALNPVDPSRLPYPFSATAAHTLYAALGRRIGDLDPIIVSDHFSADRLTGGWRIYDRKDGQVDAGPLGSISDARGDVVFLVADSTEVVYSHEPVSEHQRQLDELNG